jgi:hypothetical protein
MAGTEGRRAHRPNDGGLVLQVERGDGRAEPICTIHLAIYILIQVTFEHEANMVPLLLNDTCHTSSVCASAT